ncbi:MAG: hypothetical protein H6652_05980 [Ardenticatenaceae bacterium]|nr:hypothetical protein [Ardenticatenaceae bacterium]MCB8946730.1 hypothetical protein [Ardenticatenaceae bacterium]
MATNSAKYLSTLHKQIDQYFSFSEVRTLCFNLGVDYENIPGDHRSAFIRNLIVSLAKQNRLQELIEEVRAERAFVDWQDVPANFELPSNIAQENIQQVVNYHVYSGDVIHGNVDKSTTYNQQGQIVHGPQINAAGDANIGQIGDKIDTGGGDYVGGDKFQGDKVGGDKISVGNIENAQGVAIGGGASANVNRDAAPAERPSPTHTAPTISNITVQEAVDKVNRYLQMASDGQKEAAVELTNGMNLILRLAAQQPADALHLKLICLGQQQLAQELASDVAGLDLVVAQFVTAVQNQ